MMFDIVKLRTQVSFRDVESAGEFVFEVAHLRGVSDAIAQVPKERRSRWFCFDSLVSFRFSGCLTGSARGGIKNFLVQVR